APEARLIEIRFPLTTALRRSDVHAAGRGRPSLRSASVCDERGRGLCLVNELAARWGCCPRVGGIGKSGFDLTAPTASLAA
ncbi:hypothetical protein VM98_34170, partial [Streptomyces rubellomurinus subsp. indigoferus]